MNEPTNCQVCKTDLNETRYVYNYQINKAGKTKVVGAFCWKCDDKRVLQKYIEDKKLSTRLVENNYIKLMNIEMHKDWKSFDKEGDIFLEELKHRIDIQLSNNRIHTKSKEFEKEIWFNGLQKQIRDSKVKGVSAHTTRHDEFCVLTYSMCARTMITIEDKWNSITLITTENSEESHMGFRGISATEEEAVALIEMALSLYRTGELKFMEDTKVSMGF